MSTEHSKTDDLPILRTIKDIAARCRVSERTVRRWIDSGDLAVHRLGGCLRITQEDFARFLKRHRE